MRKSAYGPKLFDSVIGDEFIFAPHATATAIGGPNVPQVEANAPGGQVPFRRATTQRTAIITSSALTMTASEQNVEVEIPGTGYIYSITLEVTGTAAGNSAAVAFQEDAPYSAISSVILADVNGQAVNTSGWHLAVAQRYGGWMPHGLLAEDSSDPNLWNLASGVAATDGSFKFMLDIPVGLNRRTLLGLLANQDRSQKYSVRSNLAASGDVYSTAPTVLPSVSINRYYDNYAVPAQSNGNGAQQQIMPDNFGALHFITQSVNPGGAPQGSSTVNHYLPRLGKTIRNLLLIFRLNGSRGAAEVFLPSRISFKLGDQTVWTESPSYRRWEMLKRFGFDAPDGVLVYDALTDLLNAAGSEFGDDWMFTQGLTDFQFEMVYPSGMGSTNNTLTVITDDMEIPANAAVFN